MAYYEESDDFYTINLSLKNKYLGTIHSVKSQYKEPCLN
jgi:hypothetical protein